MAIGWDAYITALTLLCGLVVLYRDWIGPDFVFLGMLGTFLTLGFVSIEDALKGFGNNAPLSVAVLFVVASGIQETGALDLLLLKVLGTPKSPNTAVIKVLGPVMVASAFMNNTPLVAIMIPIIASWTQRLGLSPQQFYIPLSFAAVLGGTCTLIGTSTNLVVSGQMTAFGYQKPGFLDVSRYGVPMAVWGLIYMYIFAPILLPGRKPNPNKAVEKSSFLVGLQVPSSSPVVGQTVDNAGLRGLDNLYLASVKRGSHVISAVGPEFVIAEYDILFFTGVLEDVQILAERYDLRPITDDVEENIPAVLLGSPSNHSGDGKQMSTVFDESVNSQKSLLNNPVDAELGHRQKSIDNVFRLMQANVKEGAPIIGKTVREIGFRDRFKAAIIAITRCAERIHGNMGDIVLGAGDLIVMNISNKFDAKSEDIKKNFENLVQAGFSAEREFMVAMEVTGPTLDGTTIQKAGLRGLPQLYLIEIERKDDKSIAAPSEDEKLRRGDVLWFAGEVEGVKSVTKVKGLSPLGGQINKLKHSKNVRRLIQAVVSPMSDLVGKSVVESQFRTNYHAAIIGVHRQGQRIKEKIGNIILKGGDVLLLDTSKSFIKQYKNNKNFALVSAVEDSDPIRYEKAYFALFALFGMIGSQLLVEAIKDNFVELITAALLASAFMLVTGCMSCEQARSSVSWPIVITVSAAFGVSKAMENCGLAETIADGFISVGNAIGGDLSVMMAMYIGVTLLNNLIANNAIAALMFPIAESIAKSKNISIGKMSSVLMLAASSDYLYPFGYQTNLMVYAAGGYKVWDFFKFGAPMQVWLTVVVATVLALDDYSPIVWGVSFGAAVFIFSVVPIKDRITSCFKKDTLVKSRSFK